MPDYILHFMFACFHTKLYTRGCFEQLLLLIIRSTLALGSFKAEYLYQFKAENFLFTYKNLNYAALCLLLESVLYCKC